MLKEQLKLFWHIKVSYSILILTFPKPVIVKFLHKSNFVKIQLQLILFIVVGYVPATVYNEVAPPPVTSPPMQLPLGVFLPPGPPPTAPAAPPYPPPPLLNYLPPPTYQPMALQPPVRQHVHPLTYVDPHPVNSFCH